MKVRLLRDTTGPNPLFNADEKRRIEAAGDVYNEPHTLVIPAGTEIEHPDAHRLCQSGYLNASPLAEPIDAAAQARHARYVAERPQRLAKLKLHIKSPPKDPQAKAHLRRLADAYGLDPITGDEKQATETK